MKSKELLVQQRDLSFVSGTFRDRKNEVREGHDT